MRTRPRNTGRETSKNSRPSRRNAPKVNYVESSRRDNESGSDNEVSELSSKRNLSDANGDIAFRRSPRKRKKQTAAKNVDGNTRASPNTSPGDDGDASELRSKNRRSPRIRKITPEERKGVDKDAPELLDLCESNEELSDPTKANLRRSPRKRKPRTDGRDNIKDTHENLDSGESDKESSDCPPERYPKRSRMKRRTQAEEKKDEDEDAHEYLESSESDDELSERPAKRYPRRLRKTKNAQKDKHDDNDEDASLDSGVSDDDEAFETPLKKDTPPRRLRRQRNAKAEIKNKSEKSYESLDSGLSDDDEAFETPLKLDVPPRRSLKRRKAKTEGKSTNKNGHESLDSGVSSDDEAVETPTKTSSTSKSSRKRVNAKVTISSPDEGKNCLDVNDSDDSAFDPSDDGSVDNYDNESVDKLSIQRIIASRKESRKKWREIMMKMNTSEIDNGSRWYQEDGTGGDDNDILEKYLVKWSDLGYLHCSWEGKADLIEQIEGVQTFLRHFSNKSINGCIYDADERADGDYHDPSWIQIERILEIELPEDQYDVVDDVDDKGANNYDIILDKEDPNYESGRGRQFLVKWCNLSYTEATYEFERDLIINEVEYKEHLKSFEKRTVKPTKNEFYNRGKNTEKEIRKLYKIFGESLKESQKVKEAKVNKWQDTLAERVFKNGGQLRDYQVEGVSWFVSNYVNGRSSILADEMGLGKTVQTAIFIQNLVDMGKRGPFLIVAPLSTIPHWYREFKNWTDLNTIIYHGTAPDRELIREFEFAYPSDRPTGTLRPNQSFLRSCFPKKAPKWQKTWMIDVVITTPEMFVTPDFRELAHIHWEVLVVDEAHRMKNHTSKFANNLRNENFSYGHVVLLTGTPIQNNMNELWTLLNFIDEETFDNLDNFLSQYGDMKSKDSVDALHEIIRPYILRRLKEDVEKSVPPKEETVIEVELTVVQKKYYRALYEKNHSFLLKNKKKAVDGPSLNNLAMQLRKCCNHPFLLKGVEQEIRRQEFSKKKSLKKIEDADELDFLVKASGKLVLLDKLLPHLKKGGHRVLIFSQFKIMLDVIEDYLHLRDMKSERIDGSITGRKRQMSIDRFQNPNGDAFIMLLSTRAGGVGINLTAADTCIIFDSDWNPQNDLQAQARCHRIGQTKDVKVYRLLARKTYEMQMFHMSSLKMGLETAVLQGFGAGSGNGENELTKEEVERLLKHGAYNIFNEEKAGTSDAASNEFIAQDIDSILARRTKTIIHENTGSNSNAAGSTFSKASFKVTAPGGAQQHDDVDIDDPDFWKKMLGEAREKKDENIITPGKKRHRRKANYRELDEGDDEAKGQKSPQEEQDVDDASGYSDDGDDNSDDDASVEEGPANIPSIPAIPAFDVTSFPYIPTKLNALDTSKPSLTPQVLQPIHGNATNPLKPDSNRLIVLSPSTKTHGHTSPRHIHQSRYPQTSVNHHAISSRPILNTMIQRMPVPQSHGNIVTQPSTSKYHDISSGLMPKIAPRPTSMNHGGPSGIATNMSHLFYPQKSSNTSTIITDNTPSTISNPLYCDGTSSKSAVTIDEN